MSCCIGLVVNPVSARDIRRIVTHAGNLQTSERVNIVLRILTTLAALGISRVLMMPDRSGLCSMLIRRISLKHRGQHAYPDLEFVDMPVSSTILDTLTAVRRMQQVGVRAIIVLGGDGTHRAVVSELLQGARGGLPMIPIAGLSTGTNNAFPHMGEPTVVALAVGLYASGRLSSSEILVPNKVLEVEIDDGRRDIAIVDAVIASDRFVGVRALWRVESIESVYLTFADPRAIGFSAIGGLLEPVSRDEERGLVVHLARNDAQTRLFLQAPIAPGFLSLVALSDWEPMYPDQSFAVQTRRGVVALDGERELVFEEGQNVRVTLRDNAFVTVDVGRSMRAAAYTGAFRISNNKQ